MAPSMPGIAKECPCLSGKNTEIGTSEGQKLVRQKDGNWRGRAAKAVRGYS